MLTLPYTTKYFLMTNHTGIELSSQASALMAKGESCVHHLWRLSVIFSSVSRYALNHSLFQRYASCFVSLLS